MVHRGKTVNLLDTSNRHISFNAVARLEYRGHIIHEYELFRKPLAPAPRCQFCDFDDLQVYPSRLDEDLLTIKSLYFEHQ